VATRCSRAIRAIVLVAASGTSPYLCDAANRYF